MNLFYQPALPSEINHLDAEESRHCVKVLRRKDGDGIDITDGVGGLYHAKLTSADPAECKFMILDKKNFPSLATLHLAVAPTKNHDRMEWLVEKAVEIGIARISFIKCHHSERLTVNVERIRKVAISAMKQSIRYWLPEINEIIGFNEFVARAQEETKLIAEISPLAIPLNMVAGVTKKVVALIGPEGGFSEEELKLAISKGYSPVSLSKNRLRTETAALTISVLLNNIAEHD